VTFHPRSERERDQQDHIERHIFGEQEYVEGAGSVVRVRGTGTEDQEAMVIATGFGFNLAKNSDAEVILMAGSSDSGLKFAIMTLPPDKQRKWKEGRGGIQNPLDPDHALEFKDDQLHLTKGTLSVGNGTIEVKDGQIYIRGNVTVTGTLTVNEKVVTPTVVPGTDPDVPPFSAD
jgi:hypothetical protein